jgi:hypothetical protein
VRGTVAKALRREAQLATRGKPDRLLRRFVGNGMIVNKGCTREYYLFLKRNKRRQ